MRSALMTPVSASRRPATNSHPFRACLIVILVVVVVPRLLSAARAQTWIELRSPDFIVVTNANEKQAQRVAYQFEMVRALFREYFGISGSAKDQPIIIIAARDEDTLKTLLPEYWAKTGSMHPPGFYLGRPEKNYIALRLDVSMNQSAYEPYEPVYHEYVHYLTRRLMSQMPLWLVEGLAEFYGNIRIEDKAVWVGAPSTSNVMLLRQTPPLKLSALFAVTASSPYYHEQNKASIFYAESWALTHYLISRDWREKTHRVNDFVALLGKNVPEAEAARQSLGDPAALEGALGQYIHNVAFSAARLNAPAIDESNFQVVPFSEAESLAVRADFMVYDRHYAEAQAMLEEALKLDPKLADACESMGFLYFQQGKTAEASKWYSEAVALNPQSYSANFYYAANLLKVRLDDDTGAKAESSLRTALKINPDFAPAYNTLAYLLAEALPVGHQKPDEAYIAVLHAIELEPGNVYYRIGAVQVYERLGRAEDAVTVANLAVSLARTPQEQAAAAAALSSAQQFQAYHNRAEEFRKAQASAELSGQTTQTPAPNVGGGAFRVGGGVSPPRPVFTTSPDQKPQSSQTNDYGLGTGARGRQMGALDILSDTQGVDFGPYLQRVVQQVRDHWYLMIPESVKMKEGKLAIEFAITRDGNVADMRLVSSSGDAELDRPAWGSITGSNPFSPLPSEFTGPYLALRFRFYYNPDKSDLTRNPSESPGKSNFTPKFLPGWVQKDCPAPSGVAVCLNVPSDLELSAGGARIVTATVGGTKEQAVDWIVECSSSACGKMTDDVYTAPIVRPNPPVVTLTAISKADPTAKASVTIHLVRPASQIPTKP